MPWAGAGETMLRRAAVLPVLRRRSVEEISFLFAKRRVHLLSKNLSRSCDQIIFQIIFSILGIKFSPKKYSTNHCVMYHLGTFTLFQIRSAWNKSKCIVQSSRQVLAVRNFAFFPKNEGRNMNGNVFFSFLMISSVSVIILPQIWFCGYSFG